MGQNSKARVGIIGAGGISQVAHIPNIARIKEAEVAAVCDVDASRAAAVAERFGVKHWYDEPERMLREERLDCVVLATPTITHLPLARLALEQDCDLMVEKPFARNVDEARQIVDIAQQQERLLMVGMNHRFREDTAHLRGIVASGDLGDVISVRAGWLKRLGVWGRPYWFTDPKLAGGGVVMDLGLQMIDLVMFILGFPAVLEAYGSVSNAVLELEVEDAATGFIRFTDDVTFTLDVCWANCEKEDVAYTLFNGSMGNASLNPLRVTRRQRDRVAEVRIPTLVDQMELYRRSFYAEAAHFVQCVRERREPVSTGREALKVMEVIQKLYLSSGN